MTPDEQKIETAAREGHDLKQEPIALKWEYIEAFKAGVKWRDANPGPEVEALVEALKTIRWIVVGDLPRDVQMVAKEALKKWEGR